MASSQGAANRVAEALRQQIVSGELEPGTRLSEERIREVHGVSRSTLREAFQRLIRERLLVHELSRGVFVRRLTRADITDLYEVRRVLEGAALRHVTSLAPAGLRRLSAALKDGREAAAEGRWEEVSGANNRFHEALVSLAGSERLDAIMSGVLGEFRLAYGYWRDRPDLHQRFLNGNIGIAEALRDGDLKRAGDLLDAYLHDSETVFPTGLLEG